MKSSVIWKITNKPFRSIGKLLLIYCSFSSVGCTKTSGLIINWFAAPHKVRPQKENPDFVSLIFNNDILRTNSDANHSPLKKG